MGGENQAFLRTVQIREEGGYFRNQRGTFSLAFDHGKRKSCDASHLLIGMMVAFEFRELELVGRIAGQHPLTWFAVTQAS